MAYHIHPGVCVSGFVSTGERPGSGIPETNIDEVLLEETKHHKEMQRKAKERIQQCLCIVCLSMGRHATALDGDCL